MEQVIHPRNNINLPFVHQIKWPRVILLCVLGYEGLGAMVGGFMLVTQPDGRYMQMPVEMMHGVFKSFLVPGVILFALGLLTTFAFFSVLLKKQRDWLMAGLALEGYSPGSLLKLSY